MQRITHKILTGLLIITAGIYTVFANNHFDQDRMIDRPIAHDVPRDGETRETPPPEKSRPRRPALHYNDIDFNSQQECQCTTWKGDWTAWSNCAASTDKCYRATQSRLRKCQRGCNRVQTRNCLDKSTCTGTWGPWIDLNTTCTQCNESGSKHMMRFCKSASGHLGPYCINAGGKMFQEKEETCTLSCDDLIATPLSNLNSQQQISGNQNGGGTTNWISSSKSNFIVIILAVVAGVLLVALVFVSFLLASTKKRHTKPSGRSRGMSRDCRSVSESNISGTSYLSAGDSRASGRTALYQQHKGSHGRRSLMLPRNLSLLSMGGNTNTALQVRTPMQHTDSLMLVRKQIYNKRINGGSLRSINKLLKERTRTDHVCFNDDSDEPFIIDGFGHDDVVVRYEGKRENIPRRRATDGAYDTYERQQKRNREQMNEDDITFQKDEQDNGSQKQDDSLDIDRKDSKQNNNSENEKSREMKKQNSVEDICRMFESKSVEQSPTLSHPKDNNTSRTGDADDNNETDNEKAEHLYEDVKTSSSKPPRSPAKLNVTEPTPKKQELKPKPDFQDTSSDSDNAAPRSREYRSNTSPKKSTFLFSQQAYKSLQRSSSRNQEQKTDKSGFKIDVDAMRKHTNKKTTEDKKTETPSPKKVDTNSNKRHESYPEGSDNRILIPPTRLGVNSFDPDVYADVWDATDVTDTQDDNVYANVWDTHTPSRKSICVDDDEDYSEVYDATNSTKIAQARRFAMEQRQRSRTESMGRRKDPKPRLKHGSTTSCDSSPIRPPLPMYRKKTEMSRESLIEKSDNNRISGSLILPPDRRNSGSCAIDHEDTNEPIYCAI